MRGVRTPDNDLSPCFEVAEWWREGKGAWQPRKLQIKGSTALYTVRTNASSHSLLQKKGKNDDFILIDWRLITSNAVQSTEIGTQGKLAVEHRLWAQACGKWALIPCKTRITVLSLNTGTVSVFACTAMKIPFMNSFHMGIARPPSQFPHSCACLWAIYIFLGSIHIFPAAELADRWWENKNRSQTKNVEIGIVAAKFPFLGIFVSNFQYWFFAVWFSLITLAL